MTKRIVTLVFAFVLFLAMTLSAFAATGSPRLYDGADLLTDSEERALLEKINRVSEEYGVEIVIATVNSTGNYSADEYVEYYYDENGYGFGSRHDGVLLLISMQERDYRILSNGFGATAITLYEIDSIGDYIVSYLSSGDYYAAFDEFIDECEYQINGEINGFPFDFSTNLILALIVGFVVAFIATGVMRAKLKSVRMRSEATEYVKKGSMQVTVANDFFLYRTISCRKKESSSSNSSRSSGSSRNVGGGKF